MTKEHSMGDNTLLEDYYLQERVKISSDLIIKHLSKLDARTKLKIVDLGCGDGRAVEKMMAVLTSQNIDVEKLFAIDIDPKINASDNVEVIKADLNRQRLPLSDNSIHVIYSLETIEHLVNPHNFVNEAYRILVKHGIIVFTTPNMLAWYNRLLFLFGSLPIHYEVTELKNYGRILSNKGPTVGHIRVFSPRAAKELLLENGFKVLETKGLTFLNSKDNTAYGKFGIVDSIFSHIPSLSSMFSIVALKEG